MKKKPGFFTIVELMIGVAIVGIVLTVILNASAGLSGSSSVSFGFNGMTEIRCIDGYKFVISSEGQARQVLDEFGKGARCN